MHAHAREPAEIVARHLARIPRGRALDVAMGEGRHALLLAAAGFDVVGVDRDAEAVDRALETARARGLRLDARVADLEREGAALLEPAAFALIVNVNYLQRDLLARFSEALRPGGWLLFETFTEEHPRVSRAGRPRNPDFLLRPGELRERFGDLEIVEYEVGVFPVRPEVSRALGARADFNAQSGIKRADDREAVARLAARKAMGRTPRAGGAGPFSGG
jgi:SAM-dependent methyltransferase